MLIKPVGNKLILCWFLAYLLKCGLDQVGWKHVAVEDNIENTSIVDYFTRSLFINSF